MSIDDITTNTQIPLQPQTPPPVMNTQPPNPYVPVYQVPAKPSRDYSVKENIFAWLCYFLAYIFCLSIPISYNPLGAYVVIVLMFVSTFAVLIKGKKPKTMPMLVASSALIVSACLVTTSSDFMRFYAFAYSIIAYCYFLYGMSSDKRFSFSDGIIIDFVKAVFVLPFCSFADMFKAMFTGKSNKSGRFILRFLLGVAIAVIPTVMIFNLLSFDSSFTQLLDKIFDFDIDSVFTHIFSLLFGIPVGAYIFGLFISSTDKKCEDVLTPDTCKKNMTNMRIAPAVTILTAVLPILFIYVVFFISQWDYYISGFTGVLPENFSYAEYAREGFFQLCTVSVINLVIIILISLFLKRKGDKPSVILRVLSIVFSLCTLILISTAVAKMVMYIDCYGLTPKRVYASWFMFVLALIFVLIIVKQFVSKLRVIALSLAVLVVMFTALALSGVDGYIAQYNVDRYIDGSLSSVDIDAMEDLGDAAIPSMVRLYDVLFEKIDSEVYEGGELDLYTELTQSLDYKGRYLLERDAAGERDIWSLTLPLLKAEQALDTTPFYSRR